MEPIRIEDFLAFRYLSAPGFSPDGKLAAFVVQTPSLEENTYHGDIYLLDMATRLVRPLTAGGDAKTYVWTKEGTILFFAMRDDALKRRAEEGEELTCCYEISPFGGEARLAFTLPVRATRLTPLDSERYIVSAVYDNGREDVAGLAEDERKKILKERQAYEVLEEAPFWANGAGFTSGKRNRLYLYNRSTAELKSLTGPWFDTLNYDVLGAKVLYQGGQWECAKNQWDYPGLYLFDADTGKTRCVLPPKALRTGSFAFRDCRTAVVAASDGGKYGMLQYPDLYTLDLDTDSLCLLARYEAGIGHGSVGSDARLGGGTGFKSADGVFYFITTLGDGSYLRALYPDGRLSETLTKDGSCDSFDVFGDHILVCGLYGQKLPELYLNGEQVTFFNDAWYASHRISVPEFHSFTASDGFEIHGWVMKPIDYRPGRSYPAVLHIHGGPRTVFGDVYHHEMQVWANAGYFVFFCNPRGSDGRGNEFADIRGRYGTVEYENIMEFTDEMLKLFPDADAGRLGVAGGSYGGFMVNWIIGHTDRFAAAVSQRSISNWITYEHTSDIGYSFTQNNVGATTREDTALLWRQSPLKYADRCKTPTLFIHSDRDYRDWMAEGISMFTALKLHGCEARLCLFKDENHELSRSGRPQNRIRRMEEILGWLDKYLKGEE